MIKPVLLFFFLAFTGSFSLVRAQPSNAAHTLFLIGDCGEPVIMDSPIGSVLKREVAKAGSSSTVIYLGDNVYPAGLPGVHQPGRERGEKILQTQVNWIKDVETKGIFIPGNHDWQHWNRNGWDFIRNQQQWIDSLKDKNITLLPRDGCPGPVEMPINEQLVLIILDTQWLLHGYEKPGEESDCDAKDPAALMTLLDDALMRHAGKRVILAAHHPVITYGDHGGVFTWKDHLLPLTDIRPHLYIPLPVLGSLYPLYRGVFGHPQDVKHPVYNEYSKLVQRMLSRYPGTVYVAGHEHALQHIVKDSVYYIVSGSGSKTTYVRKKEYARFAEGLTGFVKLHVAADGAASVEFWQADKDYPDGKVVYEEQLMPVRKPVADDTAGYDFSGQYVKTRASKQYHAGDTRQFLLGENYRKAWEAEIEVPVFDIGREKGGLKILQKGGGQQTLSLRLADSTGREYVLRSVEKYPEGAVPEMLRKTFAQDLVQDQISASHPYAALVIPGLAEAAGIYHTNPRLVFIPDDKRLGLYRKDFANTLALFEERPDDDWSDKAYFGNSKKIISTAKVLEKLQKDSDNQVDQRAVVRARLFDLWIGDWDRHDDQWRWASYKKKKEEVYRPIPRDRDQAFFVNEGVLPKIWSRKWALPKFEGFDEAINWPSGMSFNARYFDRSFLNEPEEKVWVETALALQTKLSDTVIETAIKQWPEPIYDLHGPAIIERLKARREQLVDNARSHYEFLAREVDVTGSDKDERFEVRRLPAGDVNVTVYKLDQERVADKKVYERLFKKEETREIRLYGLGGEDQFDVKGATDRSIRLRIIGGAGSDSLSDQSRVSGISKKTLFYDDNKGNSIQSGDEVKDLRSGDPAVNLYDRESFTYNRLAPLLYGNFNPDDGLFFGGGFLFQTEGFRKNPFHQRHILLASVAPRTNSYNLLYRGDFTEVIGKWGLAVNADVKSPNYVNNFFGLGNETEFNEDIDDQPGIHVEDAIDYYRFRFEEQKVELYLKRTIAGSSTFAIGPAYQRVEIEEPDGTRFIEAFAQTLPYDLYDEYNAYAGLAMDLVIDKRNDPKFTSRGAYINLASRTMAGLDKRANDFSSLDGALSLYHSFSFPERLVFAARVGGGRTFGDYDFYQAQILSGRTELRGFRKTRFYGDRKFFTNLEARLKLFSVRTYLFPASVGLLGFYDVGRVWYKDENGIDPSAGGRSDKWHNGWGGGLWFTPFNFTVVSVEAGHSEEGTLGYVRLGFLF